MTVTGSRQESCFLSRMITVSERDKGIVRKGDVVESLLFDKNNKMDEEGDDLKCKF